MVASQIYIAISILALAAIAILVFFVKGKKQKKLSALAGLSFAFVVAGIVFGDDAQVGYGLIGAGLVLAVIDIVVKSKKR
ncbi:MAG: hypothetical protein V1731_00675 [Candidatus Aenigmatarchaeota archaeon]